MADTDEEVIVTIDPATTDNTGSDAVTEDPAKALAQQWEDLKADNERERKRAEAAERREAQARADATQARQQATVAHSSAVESQYDTVASGLEATKAEVASAKQEYAAAFEKGDAAAMAEANYKIANAAARAARLDEAKAELEFQRKQPQRQQQRTERAEARQDAVDDDPVESYVRGRAPQTTKWLRAHSEYITDRRKNMKLNAAHTDALAEGFDADSEEYFDHIESFIGLNKQQNGSGNGRDQSQVKRKSSVPPSAPVHQSGGGLNGGNGREVRLTKGEAERATDGTLVWNYDDPSVNKKFKKGDPIGIQEMARRKLDGQRRGLYDRTYVEQ